MMKRTILLIDDEPAYLEMMKMRLEASHYKVETAPDGVAGVEKAQQINPDLILLDVMMPGKDGFQTLQALKGIPLLRRKPIIMMTARGESSAISKACRVVFKTGILCAIKTGIRTSGGSAPKPPEFGAWAGD
jgi:DNA-binding response OmpR family regulator